MTEKTCLVLGDINIDFNLQSKAYPPEGGMTHAEQADFRLGGSGCITSIALNWLGCPTTLAGNLGCDLFADFTKQHIQAAGMSTRLVRKLPGQQTGFFMIVATAGGQQTMFGNRGSNALPLPEAEITQLLPTFNHLHISGYTLLGEEQFAVVRHILTAARTLGLTSSLDPGMCTSQEARDKVFELLPHIHYFLPNTDELNRLAGEAAIHDQIRFILEKGCESIAVKMGAAGSQYVDQNQTLHQPAIQHPNARQMDPTGAGDCFNAGFLKSMLAGSSPQEALLAGNRVAFDMITSPHGILDFIYV